jgi:transcriptional regulator
MFPASYAHEQDAAALEAHLRRHPLSTLALAVGDRPFVVQVPVVVRSLPGGLALDFHISRRNAVAPHLVDGARGLIISAGPQAYISPDWVGGGDKEVPTWNYVAVEAEGPLALLAPEGLTALLADLSAQEEARLLPKKPWTLDKIDPDYFQRLSSAIVGARLTVERLEGTAKLSQNKPEADRAAIAAALGDHPIADLMRR